ncbi:ATP-dependent RNA helicase DHX33-like [Planococcus citri]|uniref:ATP-dependent RNA helicase DHX33-like n=1 Tax=Planococcus citri TaxID=170843 RepID=UPI0031F8D530
MPHKVMNENTSGELSSGPKELQNNAKFKRRCKIFDEKHRLPIYAVRKSLIQKLREHDTVIILGETGCGKTTQLPQYILESSLNNGGGIVVTQPRRIAAISIANRVAEEINEQCGQRVGYKIRFYNNTGPRTVLTYATDGTLLREAVNDELLAKYNVVILDEAHERTVTTDILFGIVKSAQKSRKQKNMKPLKIVIMSAALNVDHFHSYFDNAPVLHIEGRNYQVEIYFTKEDIDDYYFTCLTSVFNIHTEAPPNEDILVFLTGQEEIEKMVKDIKLISKNPECTGPPISVYSLYASSDAKNHTDVFQPSAKGTRKIIVSTNIAETSVTIPGIKYVIDSGKVKMKFHNPVTGVDILKVVNISHEQALQRTGRAGRESNGVCYRAYSSDQYEKLSKSVIPEIRRCNLSAVTLNLLAMGKNPRTFDFIDKPDEAIIVEAMQDLNDLGAVVKQEIPRLTTCGEKMAELPLDPKYSKILISAVEFNCLDEILDIIAMLSTDNIFISSSNEDVFETRKKFYSSMGDHITLFNIYKAFNTTKCKKEWCKENYLNFRALEFAQNVKKQLTTYCSIFRFQITSCGNDLDSVRKCLITGLFKNVAVLQSDKTYVTVVSKQRAIIHPSSSLHRTLPYCVLFSELIESNDLYMKNVTMINSEWLPQCVPNYVSKKDMYNIPENKHHDT